MTQTNGIENKLVTNERSFLEKVIDGSGAAIGTSFATRALLIGASLPYTILAYLLPYSTFKAAKYAYNVIRHPFKSLSWNGVSGAIYDTFSNIFPYKDRVPASVGVVSGGVSYLL